jgi:hypothetical protein
MSGEFGYLLPEEIAEQFDPREFRRLQYHVDALFGSSYRIDRQEELEDINMMRPTIAAALSEEEAMPAMVDILTRLSDVNQPGQPHIGDKVASNVLHRSTQLTVVNFDRLQTIADTDEAGKGDQARVLLVSSVQHMQPHGEHADYIAANLQQSLITEYRKRPGKSWAHLLDKYDTILEKLVWGSEGRQSDAVIDQVNAIAEDPETNELGQALMARIVLRETKDDPRYQSGVTGKDHLTRLDYIKYMTRANKFAHRETIKSTPNVLLIDGLDEMTSEAAQHGLEDEFWAATLRNAIPDGSYSKPHLGLVRKALKHYGIDYDKVLESAWRVGAGERAHSDYQFEQYIRGNLTIIRKLEAAQRGSTALLLNEYGIRNFMRYPINVLIDQAKEHGNTTSPYGAMIYAVNSHNLAFDQNSSAMGNTVQTLHQQLKERDHLLRIYECDSGVQVLRALLQARWRFKQPMSFAVAVAHGQFDSMSFKSPDGTNNSIYKSDVYRRLINSKMYQRGRIGKGAPMDGSAPPATPLWQMDATGALNSCLTGQERGIGDAVSKMLDLPLTAQTTSTNIKRIDTRFSRRGGVHLSPTYVEAVARRCGLAAIWSAWDRPGHGN